LNKLTGRTLRLAFGLVLMTLVASSCLIGPADPSAQFFAASRASANIASTGTVSSKTSQVAMQVPRGPVARPDAKLTPGVVAIHDLATVCRQAKHTKGLFAPLDPLITPANQQAVFAAYKISVQQEKRYGLDFLIPLQLGGANVPANIWPVSSSRGVGFREKEVLNQRMHILVCHGDMPLDQAQREMAGDWVKLWVAYGA
jgi:hypothetical protein